MNIFHWITSFSWIWNYARRKNIFGLTCLLVQRDVAWRRSAITQRFILNKQTKRQSVATFDNVAMQEEDCVVWKTEAITFKETAGFWPNDRIGQKLYCLYIFFCCYFSKTDYISSLGMLKIIKRCTYGHVSLW